MSGLGRFLRSPLAASFMASALVFLCIMGLRRAGSLESLDGVADRLLVQGIQARIVHPFCGHGLDQRLRPRDAADRLRGNWDHPRHRARYLAL